MTTHYHVAVRDLRERQHDIETKAAATNERRPFYHLQGREERLPVIWVDLGLPLYRMENYRTQTAQGTWIRQHNLRDDFFATGTEDVDAQQAQHALLVDLARSNSSSILAITTALETDRRQTEALLITREGIVVNGNRRLAAMRELFQQDPAEFERFGRVEVMVLPPDIDQNDIRRIEVRLQMQPETRLPYDWINTALAVRDLRLHGLQPAEIAPLMRLKRESEVTDMIEQLEEAEFYLAEYINKPNEYQLIEKHDQLFGDLQAAVRTKRSAGDKESARRIGHVLAKNSAALGARVYDYNPAFGKRMTDVMDRLALRHNIPLATDDGADDDLFGGGDEMDPYRPVRELLKDSDRSEALAEDIREIYDTLREEDREQDVAKKALKKAKQANTLLAELSLAQAGPETFDEIRSHLEGIQRRTSTILEELDTRLTGRPAGRRRA